ncbi:hypothetical protein M446_2536 [Methylobacterium sp. 4-46]|uniref:hypothetical protein n=1 Tax=unclassified Methylobacterium TaxID=2615210 RepID=UPI000152D1FB|nr:MULTISPECIES: hypothetical protein [Methylobacterium]ACA16979.1 hypothetical protein M446_2536 [Methylobacterium sp. 4-46]WFT82668.1 hypothetical protein QA634_12840 [Methylobacterium nodulans]
MDEAQLEDETTFNMLCDVALVEPNQRGRRVFDGFLGDRLASLDSPERDLAPCLADAFFSIFRVAGRHEHSGVWVEDLLASRRRLWLLDERVEASAPENLVIAVRVFDAGPSYAGVAIVVQPDEDMAAFCTAAAARCDRMPARHALAAGLYRDGILPRSMHGAAVTDILAALAEAWMPGSGQGSGAKTALSHRQHQAASAGRRNGFVSV